LAALVLAGLGVTLATLSLAAAAPGDLDPSFAGKGWAHTREFFHYDQEYIPKGAEDLARQPDGKLVLTGEFQDGQSTWYYGAYRLTAAGGLDRSFGEGGWVDTKVGTFDFPHAVAIQRDGKILLAGESTCDVAGCAAVVRYLPSGALDPSFGTGGIVRLGGRRIQGANDVAVLPDGKILVLGWQFNHGRWHDYTLITLVRLLSNGKPDRSFSRDGFAHVGLRRGQFPHAMTVQHNGKIVIAGYSSGSDLPNTAYFEIARVRRDGRPDRSFSGDGYAFVDWRGRDESASDVAVQRDGRIVVVGTSGVFVKYWTDRIAVARLNRNGTLDRSFGKRLTKTGRYGSSGNGVLIQPDGRIVVAGSDSDDRSDNTSAWAVARYLRNGRLDRSFGHGGIVIGDFGTGHDWASSLALQPDGKLLVAGSIYEDEAVARYTR
jgi:uncharacterized delta-60 repeat protein